MEQTHKEINQAVDNLMLPGGVRIVYDIPFESWNIVANCLLEKKSIALLLSILNENRKADRENAARLLNYMMNCVKRIREVVAQKDGIWYLIEFYLHGLLSDFIILKDPHNSN